MTGGSSNWVSSAPTIKVSSAGTAISGVKHYEYYKSTSSTAPTDSTTATGTTSGSLTVSDEGTTYIWYRTVSNSGFKSAWTSSPQVVNLETKITAPVIAISNSNWTNKPVTVNISSMGQAVSSVYFYEYKIVPSLHTLDYVILKDNSEWYVLEDSDGSKDMVTLISNYNIVPSTGEYRTVCNNSSWKACDPIAFDPDGTTKYDVNDKNNIGYYVNNIYLPKIKKALGDNSITATIPTIEQLVKADIYSDDGEFSLGILQNGLDDGWKSYWTLSLTENNNNYVYPLYGVSRVDGIYDVAADNNMEYGIRPVITISKKNITKVNGATSKLITGDTLDNGTKITVSNESESYIYYRSVAISGNKSDWSSPKISKIDTIAPNINYLGGKINGGYANFYDSGSGVNTLTLLTPSGINNDVSSSISKNKYYYFSTEEYNFNYSSVEKENGNYYLYVEDKAGNSTKKLIETIDLPILKDIILKNNTIVSSNPTLTTSSNNTSDKSGLYKSTATNTGEPTYYFRGNVNNNYLSFAGFTWRIVRINEDGTVRIIMQNAINNDTYDYNQNYNNYKYMYYTNSEVKSILESWYQTNIGSKSNLANKVVSGNYYCEQAKAKYSSSDASGSASMTVYSSYTPNFKCASDGNKKGLVNASIGLITYDEVVYAGGYYNKSNNNYYLYNNNFWTMSPAGYSGSEAHVWSIFAEGYIFDNWLGVDTSALRPVLNLKANTQVTGTGTSSDPYKILT